MKYRKLVAHLADFDNKLIYLNTSPVFIGI